MMPSLPRQKIYKLHYANFIKDIFVRKFIKVNDKIDNSFDITKQQLKINLKEGVKVERKTERLFESLMGKKAEYRFKFIKENANFTNNLDI